MMDTIKDRQMLERSVTVDPTGDEPNPVGLEQFWGDAENETGFFSS